MLKLPKGLKKKKKGKKSKRKGEEELFTEEELEKYRREHQQAAQDAGEGPANENEEWSKFNDLTTGVDSVLKKTQGDLDRIKSTSFFQRIAPKKEREPPRRPEPVRQVVQITEADFKLAAPAPADDGGSSCAASEDESEDERDDIFDTSYVEAVERGEVRLAYVPDSPDEPLDDDIFDTSHVDAIIRGQDARTSTKGKKGLDIGIAVEVLTGRIDNVTITSKKSKRVIPGDLLLESADEDVTVASVAPASEPVEKSILDLDSDIPISSPIDLSVSLHTSLIQQQQQERAERAELALGGDQPAQPPEEDEFDEFSQLAAESLEASADVIKIQEKEIKLEPVLQESWSVFEADKNESVFAECIVEDQIDVLDPYLDQDDPFDTSFADAVVPTTQTSFTQKEAVILEDDDDDFDPRAEEVQFILNNRRKSSVRIHLTDPSGVRESITSDDLVDKHDSPFSRDLLGGSTTDLTQLGDSPLNPIDINETEIDPFDTTIVDKIVAPGKIELKLLEQELISSTPVSVPIYRVDSDPDFDPRADEQPYKVERRASRPENLTVSKSVVFDVDGNDQLSGLDVKSKPAKPVTPYYSREVSITEDLSEEAEAADIVQTTLHRTRSTEDLAPKFGYQKKRRHSEYSQPNQAKVDTKVCHLLHSDHGHVEAKVLTPAGPPPTSVQAPADVDPFDTSFATNIAPSRTELKLLAKEFSCEESPNKVEGDPDLLDPSDDLFQVKALTPEPTAASHLPEDEIDPFDTSFAGNLNPGKTELKLLESEFLN